MFARTGRGNVWVALKARKPGNGGWTGKQDGDMTLNVHGKTLLINRSVR